MSSFEDTTNFETGGKFVMKIEDTRTNPDTFKEALSAQLETEDISKKLTAISNFLGEFCETDPKDLSVRLVEGTFGEGTIKDTVAEIQIPNTRDLVDQTINNLESVIEKNTEEQKKEISKQLILAVTASTILHEATHGLLNSKPDSKFALKMEELSGIKNVGGYFSTLLDEGIAYAIQEIFAPEVEPVGSIAPRINEKDSDIVKMRKELGHELKPMVETYLNLGNKIDDEFLKEAIKQLQETLKINKAKEEGERTKATENVLKIAKQIDPENKLSGLELVEEICRYIRTMTPSQETLEEAWKNNLIPKRDKWDTSADELLSESNLIPGHNRIRNIDGCTQISYITRALLLAKGIPSLIVDTIDKEWLKNNPEWKNDNKGIGVRGHYFLDVYIPQEKKWYTINPGNREERIHEYGDYSISGKIFINMAKGKDTKDMGDRGFNTQEDRLNNLEVSLSKVN